ncbi:MAG: hypothetical protein KGZ58_12115 [Ignavibacteriales bacterium]|nr:hypothetical protein [Ignavibacteriales bacterium]
MNLQDDIRFNYPLPLRQVYIKILNSENPIECNINIGNLFEITLKYLAIVSLVEYLSGKQKDLSVQELLKPLFGNISFGHWVSILRACHNFNIKHKQTILPSDYFSETKQHIEIIYAYTLLSR